MDFHEWVTAGEDALVALAELEHAVTRHEMEAKLSDQRITPRITRLPIQPHVLTHSLKNCIGSGALIKNETPTRGGRLVATYHLPLDRGRRRLVADAAARKRLLQTRFNGWAVGGVSTDYAGTIGTAGEIALQLSMRAAASNPGTPAAIAQPDVTNPRVSQLFGLNVEIGPLDNGMLLLAGSTVIHVPVEIKNRRQWLYSDAREVFQLLCKAARLQNQYPHVNLCPVLVCRRAHWTTFNLMNDVGGYVIPTNEQYVHPEIDARLVAEVREELGYDLVQTTGARPLLTSNFAKTLPEKVLVQAGKWRNSASTLLPSFEVLRTARHYRRTAFEALLTTATNSCGITTTDKWRTGTSAGAR